MKRLVIVIVWLLSIPSIAFSQRGAWTTKEGQLSAMIMSDEGRDSIEWMDVNGVLGAVDIATIRSLPSLKRQNIRGCKIKEIPDSAGVDGRRHGVCTAVETRACAEKRDGESQAPLLHQRRLAVQEREIWTAVRHPIL